MDVYELCIVVSWLFVWLASVGVEGNICCDKRYERHARALDRRYHNGAPNEPVLERLRWFTPVRGLVFGQYGEVSDDVEDLTVQAACALADLHWRVAGARSAREMRSYEISVARRRVGMVALRSFARHRIARLASIGCDPRAVRERQRRHGQEARGQMHDATRWDAGDFFQYQGGRAAGSMDLAAP